MHRKGQNENPKNAIVYYDDENLSKTLSFLKYYFSLLQFAMFHGLGTKVSKYLIQLHVNIILNQHAILKN